MIGLRKTLSAFVPCLVIGCAAISVSDTVDAQPSDMVPADMALLPEYCPNTISFGPRFGGTPDGVAYWKERFGELTWGGMHHYCYGLLHLNRAARARTSAMDRRTHYNNAIGDFDFALARASDDFPLAPEILTRRGEALTHLKRFTDAETDFTKALKLKPDYWPAYAKLADCYVAQGKKKAAQDVLVVGISKSADPRMLKRMLENLERGGRSSQ